MCATIFHGRGIKYLLNSFVAGMASKTWRPVQVKTQTAITGGYLSKSMSVDTQVVTGDTYLKVNARIDWLLKAATGQTQNKLAEV